MLFLVEIVVLELLEKLAFPNCTLGVQLVRTNFFFQNKIVSGISEKKPLYVIICVSKKRRICIVMVQKELQATLVYGLIFI